MLTDLGQLQANLSSEVADLRKALKACEKVQVTTTMKMPMTSRRQAAMTTLIDKQEIGASVAIAAEFAVKYKKTMDRKKLDATAIKTLLVDVRTASSDITTAGIVLKHECNGCRSRMMGTDVHSASRPGRCHEGQQAMPELSKALD